MTEKEKRAKEARVLKMEIDHREVSFPEHVSVLRAAELNNIYIPSLCSHKDLSPFGGCRMCVVEIEGMRGYPLACSTVAQEGMKVLTDTATLRDMRKEILQLILSEHPSSCLVCGEKAECMEYQFTIRKTGVSTGCRYCPNDHQCELQNVVEKIGLTEITYPVYYRGYEAEHDDPFFDRDYNICILCGRCVRMCQEVRGTAILAFKYRGPKVQIGPAFGRSHVEAGCEFCGACVSVCPTGALADKSSKWDGKPDGMEVSACPFCSIGCQIELHHKEGKLSKVYPSHDAEINDGQLCVRGRFSMPEATHHHERAKKPMLKRGKYFREVTWSEAQEEVAGKLKGLKPEEFLMLVSGDLTNESLFLAQKFVRSCLSGNSIDSTARLALPGGLGLWTKLFSLPISIKGIAESDAIIAVGLDSRFYFSVVGVQIRRALKHDPSLRDTPYNRPSRDTLEVTRTRVPISVDGELWEWDAAQFFESRCREPFGEHYHVRGALMYDDRHLYVAAVVGDPSPLRSILDPQWESCQGWQGGGVQLRLITDRKSGWPSDARRGSPLREQDVSDQLVHVMMWYFEPRSQPCLHIVRGMDFHGHQVNPPGYRGAFRKTPEGTGYVLEYALTWELLAPRPRPRRDSAAAWCCRWTTST